VTWLQLGTLLKGSGLNFGVSPHSFRFLQSDLRFITWHFIADTSHVLRWWRTCPVCQEIATSAEPPLQFAGLSSLKKGRRRAHCSFHSVPPEVTKLEPSIRNISDLERSLGVCWHRSSLPDSYCYYTAISKEANGHPSLAFVVTSISPHCNCCGRRPNSHLRPLRVTGEVKIGYMVEIAQPV
jgi:hypothetical protein